MVEDHDEQEHEAKSFFEAGPVDLRAWRAPMMFCQLRPGFRLPQGEEIVLHLVPVWSRPSRNQIVRNGAQEARARRCEPRRSEPLPPSTVLPTQQTTGGGTGTR
jgi:hypothetical protein